jgi:hypothetical protein
MSTVITRISKQRRMMDFYNLNAQGSRYYLIIANNSAWTSDPKVPQDTDTMNQGDTGLSILAYRKVDSVYFVNVIANPTDAQKEDPGVIFYNGSYYEATTNSVQALANGWTRLMLTTLLNKDDGVPINVGFNQLGLLVQVGAEDYSLTPEEYASLANKGNLELIDNRGIITRSEDQQETIQILLEF